MGAIFNQIDLPLVNFYKYVIGDLDMDTLRNVYNLLLELGFVKSQREFSRDFLGKSAGYFSQIATTGALPSLCALGTLAGVLYAIVVDEAGRPADYVARRKLRSAWVEAAVILDGERKRRRYPPRRSPHLFDAAGRDTE